MGIFLPKDQGDKINVAFERDGYIKEVMVTLKKKQTLEVPVMGLTVKDLTDDDKKKFKVKKGVKIVDVPELYNDYGLEGKVLLSVDNEEINDIQEAYELFGQISRYGKTVITMVNEKGERERLIFQ
ncbi:hypothetical protein [Maribacter halichondriae]|uniref:hypothetical protein n=1 Tax=Maribacter halichondriae TaxID=2980554 RepID=UPI003076680F